METLYTVLKNRITSEHRRVELTDSISDNIFFFLRRVFFACIRLRSRRIISRSAPLQADLSFRSRSLFISSSSSSLRVAEISDLMRSIASAANRFEESSPLEDAAFDDEPIARALSLLLGLPDKDIRMEATDSSGS